MSSRFACFATLLCMAGCAANHPDHFYVLDRLPRGETVPRTAFTTQTTVRVTLPSIVDRNEIVLRNENRILVLEHERWAAPLADQLASVLSQDLEQRRPDVLITARHISRPEIPTVTVTADIVDLTVEKGRAASIEARWRVDGKNTSTTGRDAYRCPLAGEGYSEVAQALSTCIARLADRLIEAFPAAAQLQP